ncbi:MAG: 6-phosphogluconolactonase [Aquabacterium sp.]|uniref:6-phosphogluconolactonase n=1 Tax=Aquabacterium sp. TaxID=1872578 RepID=UPI0035C74136
MQLNHHTAADAATLAANLARFTADRLQAALAERERVLLVLSGGSTPVPFFEALSRLPLDWSRVVVTLADDRWVPLDHADSNARLVRTHLLQGPAAAATFVPVSSEAPTPTDGQPAIEAELAGLPWPAEVTVFGMGGDGHTASLFPQAPELAAALDDAQAPLTMPVGAPAPPNVPVPRLTLTRRALLDTRCAVIHCTGAAKRALLQRASEAGEVAELPIRIVLQQDRVPVHIFHVD